MQAPCTLAAAAALAAGYLLYKRHKRMRAPVMELPRLDGKTCTPSEVCALLRSHGVVVIDEAVPGEVMDRVVAELDGVGGTFVGGKAPSALLRSGLPSPRLRAMTRALPAGAQHSFAGHHTRRNAAKPLGESTTVQELAVHPTALGGGEASALFVELSEASRSLPRRCSAASRRSSGRGARRSASAVRYILHLPTSRLHLGYISATSRLHLGYISATSRLYLGSTSAISRSSGLPRNLLVRPEAEYAILVPPSAREDNFSNCTLSRTPPCTLHSQHPHACPDSTWARSALPPLLPPHPRD